MNPHKSDPRENKKQDNWPYNKPFTEREMNAAIKQQKHSIRRRHHTSTDDKKATNRNNKVSIRLIL